ncbi:Trypsin delta/gamma-like protein [Aphelenchoides besseyi]|nr:Trypsin delta/gamma-like protein [Aphelenchoides besseyi]
MIPAIIFCVAFGVFVEGSVPQFPRHHPLNPLNCRDASRYCLSFKDQNYCTTRVHYMRAHCKATCGFCTVALDLSKIQNPRMNQTKITLSADKMNEILEYVNYAASANDVRDSYLKARRQNITESSTQRMLPQFRVQDGEDAKLAEVQWFVQLVNFSDYSRCGGVAISENIVLTVAHCILDTENLDPNVFQLRIGSVASYYGQALRLKKIVLYSAGKYGDNFGACTKR